MQRVKAMFKHALSIFGKKDFRKKYESPYSAVEILKIIKFKPKKWKTAKLYLMAYLLLAE